jgi:ferrous iron transport protein B
MRARVRTDARRGSSALLDTVHVALAGNPNVGKSSLFNRLTGARQHVANWPGKTVERRTGTTEVGGTRLVVTDLPGTYSLAASSPEEAIAEQALTDTGLDVVAVVLDSTNLERNLYLAAQVAELGCPFVLVLNMDDAAAADGFVIDDAGLAAVFAAPVVRTVARTGEGLDALIEALVTVGASDTRPARGCHTTSATRPGDLPALPIEHGAPTDHELELLEGALSDLGLPARPSRRWLALRLLEQEPGAIATVAAVDGGPAVAAQAAAAVERVRSALDVDPSLVIADRRFGWAHEVAGAVVCRETVPRSRTDRLDDVLTHPVVGMPLFLLAMWVVFTLVVDVADPFIGWIEEVVGGPLTSWSAALLAAIGLDGGWFEALLVDGLLAGVGGVLVFVPVLAILYTALGVLEDSGYMARAAYLMDRVLSPIGLSGKSFLPLLLGFGCNVPGISATRLLERRRDRVITALLVPFVACAARLPVFVLLAGVFFTRASGTVVFAMYLLSIATVVVLGGLLDRLVLRAERGTSFVLEFPSYRRPSLRVLAAYVGQRVGAFLRGAGPVIVAGAVVVWALLAIPVTGDGSFNDTELDDSAFAATSQVLAPTMAPAGLGSWEVTGTLLTGIVAKEIMVATFHQVYVDDPAAEAATGVTAEAGDDLDVLAELRGIGAGFVSASVDAALAIPAMVGIDLGGGEGEEDTSALAAPLRAGLEETSGGYGAVAALALMVFVLLYVPCLATVAAIRQELGGRWAVLSVGMSLAVAWLAATAVFQAGRLLVRLLGGG